MTKKQVAKAEEPKKSFEEQLINILEKLARREVGVDVDIAKFKVFYGPTEPVEAEAETEEEPA